MAVQPFTQFIWGRPKIEMDLNLRDNQEGKSRFLDILLFNRPISNRFLKWLRVRRETAEDVFVECRIENIQTQQMLVEHMYPEIDSISQHALSVSLPASSTPASILLIGAFNNGTNKIYNKGSDINLIPGTYLLSVKVHCAEIISEKRAKFTIGIHHYELTWEPVSCS